MKRYAFTMIELVFVIVVLGILAAVALPKLSGTVKSAQIAKAQGDVAAIRSSIASARQKMLVTGRNTYPSKLDQLAGTTSSEGNALFDSNGTITILTYPIYAGGTGSSGKWKKTAANTYTFTVDTTPVTFKYTSGTGIFDCHGQNGTSGTAFDYCKNIAE